MTASEKACADFIEAMKEVGESFKHWDELTKEEQDDIYRFWSEEIWPALPEELKKSVRKHA